MTHPGPGFTPPPYPHDRLGPLAATAARVEGGCVDVSVGTPVDPTPDVVVEALRDAARAAMGYPPSVGTLALREAAAGWVERRAGVVVDPEAVITCVGTKEVVASLPRLLGLRDPTRDTVLYPAVSYPTYEMGARLAGLRAVPVPLDTEWRLDIDAIADADARRALVLWLNYPANPTGAAASTGHLTALVDWARARGVVVASDECYTELAWTPAGDPAPPTTVLSTGPEGVLVVHSLSKRSNMAGLRSGFIAGDVGLVRYLGEVRKHAGMMVPAPVQAAAAAAWADDTHVDEQRARYRARRDRALPALRRAGLVHRGGDATFYLWLADAHAADPAADGWALAARLAARGLLVAPGELYGDPRHVRVALTVTDDRLALALDRVTSPGAVPQPT